MTKNRFLISNLIVLCISKGKITDVDINDYCGARPKTMGHLSTGPSEKYHVQGEVIAKRYSSPATVKETCPRSNISSDATKSRPRARPYHSS